MDLSDYLYRYIRIANDRGAEYEGVLKSLGEAGSVFMEVRRIRLTGRGGTEGKWIRLKKVEIQRIPGAVFLEDKE